MKTGRWFETMGATARRFGLLDAVILMAALAAGFYLARACWYETFAPTKLPPIVRSPFVFRAVHDECAVCVAALSAAMLILRLRRPRPLLPQVFQQPGFVGCLATTVVLGMCIVNKVPERSISSIVLVASIANAYSIVAAWFAVLFAGSWNPEPGWIDRMARTLCVFWLVAPFVLCLGLTVV
jgi:hypothetical protein